MKKSTIRALEEAKKCIDVLPWTALHGSIMCIPEIDEIVEARFTEQNEKFKKYCNTDGYFKAQRKLDMEKAEWLRKWIRNWEV